ncbi:MAG: MFS transporter [Sphingomonadales bacterium]
MTAGERTDGSSTRSLGLRIGFVYCGFFLFIGMFMPYWPAWLADRGIGAAAIGLLVALTQALKIITSPLIAQLSDRSGKRRRVLSTVAVLAVVTFSLYWGADGLLALAVVTLVSHAFIPALLPLTEQIAMSSVRRGGINYGRVRASGSAAFIVAALAGGVLVDRFDTGVVLPFCLAALALTWVATLLLPGDDKSGPGTSGHKAGKFRGKALGFGPIVDLLRQPDFRITIIIISLLQASHGVYYALATIHWRAMGLDTTIVGVLWVVAVMAEIILFVVAGNRVAAMSPVKVFAMVGALGAVRWAITAIAIDPWVLGVTQSLHAMTYGATHLATMAYLARAVPESRAATAQAIYSAGPMGIAIGLVLAGAGALYTVAGGGAFHAMAVLCAGAVVLCPMMARSLTKEERLRS